MENGCRGGGGGSQIILSNTGVYGLVNLENQMGVTILRYTWEQNTIRFGTGIAQVSPPPSPWIRPPGIHVSADSELHWMDKVPPAPATNPGLHPCQLSRRGFPASAYSCGELHTGYHWKAFERFRKTVAWVWSTWRNGISERSGQSFGS